MLNRRELMAGVAAAVGSSVLPPVKDVPKVIGSCCGLPIYLAPALDWPESWVMANQDGLLRLTNPTPPKGQVFRVDQAQ